MYFRYRQYGPGIWTFKAWLIITLQNSLDNFRVFSFNIWSMVLMLYLSAISRLVSCYVPTEIAFYILYGMNRNNNWKEPQEYKTFVNSY